MTTGIRTAEDLRFFGSRLSTLRVHPVCLAAQVIIVSTIVLAMMANPIAGIFWQVPGAALAIFALRDVWTLLAAVVVMAMLSSGKHALFALPFVIGVVAFGLSAMAQKGSVETTVLFLQYRNIFGFSLCLAIAMWATRYLSAGLATKLLYSTTLILIVYCIVEAAVLLQWKVLISNVVFHKAELEAVKGTKANLDAGILGMFRLPGPIFSPSQLGIFIAYSYFVLRVLRLPYQLVLGALLWVIQVLAISKTGIVMMLLAEILLFSDRKLSLAILTALFLAPLIAAGLVDMLPDYHMASVSYHFLGFTSAFREVLNHPFGLGVGNVGTLAGALRGLELDAGFESGMGTIILSLGVLALPVFGGLAMYVMTSAGSAVRSMFVLYCAGMFFNENGLSPHLMVGQMVILLAALNRVSEVERTNRSNETKQGLA